MSKSHIISCPRIMHTINGGLVYTQLLTKESAHVCLTFSYVNRICSFKLELSPPLSLPLLLESKFILLLVTIIICLLRIAAVAYIIVKQLSREHKNDFNNSVNSHSYFICTAGVHLIM